MTSIWNHLVMKMMFLLDLEIKTHPIHFEDEEDEHEDDDNDASGGAFGSHYDIDFNFLHDK